MFLIKQKSQLSINEQAFLAAKNGDVDSLIKLTKLGLDLGVINKAKVTLPYCAAENGQHHDASVYYQSLTLAGRAGLVSNKINPHIEQPTPYDVPDHFHATRF